MENDFQHIEAIVRTWLWFAKKDRPDLKSERESSAEHFCKIIKELEDLSKSELSSRSKFEKCIHSDASEDWEDIFLTVLPQLRGEVLEALEKSLRSLNASPFPTWSDLLPEMFANQVLPLFRDGYYLSAVRRGCDALRAVIRTRTELHHLDAADLVNQAYGKHRPFAVAVWEGHSDEDIRRGYADMLRGAMMAIRNPHYHGTEEITEAEAARLLVVLGTLWSRADGTTKI